MYAAACCGETNLKENHQMNRAVLKSASAIAIVLFWIELAPGLK